MRTLLVTLALWTIGLGAGVLFRFNWPGLSAPSGPMSIGPGSPPVPGLDLQGGVRLAARPSPDARASVGCPAAPPRSSPAGEQPPQAVDIASSPKAGAKIPNPPGISSTDPRWRDLGQWRCTGFPAGREKFRGDDGRWHRTIGRAPEDCPPGVLPTVAIPTELRGRVRDGDLLYILGVGYREALGWCPADRTLDIAVLDGKGFTARARKVTGPGREQKRKVWLLKGEKR